MPSNVRWKLITILTVLVIFSAVGVYPLAAARYHLPAPGWLMDKHLKLGLDLKGGVHLVLRVQTDDALRIESQTEMERLREELTNRKINVANMALVSPTQFKVEGVPPDQDSAFRTTAQEVQTNFDRGSGVNGTYTFTMRPNIQNNLRDEAVVQARQTIERRVNELGVAEPSIAQQGANGDEILVQLPGVADVERAKSIIGSPGRLELKIVEQGPSPTRESLPRQRRSAERNGHRARRERRTRRLEHRVLRAAPAAAVPAVICAAHGRRSTRTTSRPCSSR
jgi:preprotein translocase subunit SecD